MTIISRESLADINGILIDGIWHGAGQVKDFRSNSEMSQYLPKFLSLSWVSLDQNQPLESHFHPIDSYVLILENEALLIADRKALLGLGKVIRIPKFKMHGFAPGPAGNKFWGLAWNKTTGHLFSENGGQRLVFYENELRVQSEEKPYILDLLDPNQDINFFNESGLCFSAVSLKSGQDQSFESDNKSWLIIPVDGCVDFNRKVDFKAGDFVSIAHQTVCLRNNNQSSIVIFKMSVLGGTLNESAKS